MCAGKYIIHVDIHILNLFKSFQANLEEQIKRIVHVWIVHGMLNEDIKACCDLNLHCIWFFILDLFDQVANKVILELEKVRWVDLNYVLEGLVGGGSYNFVCSLCIELCIRIK